MASKYEAFFSGDSYAVVGHAKAQNFPKLTYDKLKSLQKTVYPVDPSLTEMEGDTVFPDLASLPGPVDRIVLEVPKQETLDWVSKAAELGVKDVWIHMGRETPEALELAKEKGLNLRYGTCAVMYVTPGFSYHSIHKWIMRLAKKY
ncbi:MAG: CoA-binding protein [Proteobacteria bacterium]|nr:CoA-binding protein [Pseudomonadota bacterium]